MKQFFLLLIMLLLFSCNPFYYQYQRLNENLPKSKFYLEQQSLLKPLLKKENEPFILIISWDKSILSQENMTYKALVYYPKNGSKKLLETRKKTPKNIISSDLTDKNFYDFKFILDNYLEGKEEYLLSLHDSFSSSEVNSPYYIYDFVINKKIKLKSFTFDKDGKIIQ
ncbi:hypothetical protein SAMN05421847_0309 [Halpernia humi]|uniref:Lipoprotein n=1 Tax=Halpernia humi TaxID=493375 RepID=A0A1H5SYU0_9FLAO|nr:hypothetical protein [Halpernia humi]SEF55689.1 hypothetical protein SAMN05421847_0309 [Halpernia humi]